MQQNISKIRRRRIRFPATLTATSTFTLTATATATASCELKLNWFFWRCLPKVAGEEETRYVTAVAAAPTATVAGSSNI